MTGWSRRLSRIRGSARASVDEFGLVGGDRDLDLPVERRHRDLRPERRLGERDRDVADDVVAVAREERVFAHRHDHVEVARRPTRVTRLAFAGELEAQPVVDARALARNRYRMAMAVGDRRHYRVDSIQPRHFYQTGARAGLDEGTIRGLFAQLVADAPEAIRTTRAGLPRWFPRVLTNSILGGFNSRVALLEREIGRFSDDGDDDD